ncbi:MAG: aminotransferase class I/II-fold pyridoxal phosphate-dependent enzyme [Synechococcus sp.]|nr:aminotransferase class I/II-fold pyridoxal phosphate-dependent enzyme [Synechococcus sp.]
MARQLGCRPEQLLDASASLVPFGPPLRLRLRLLALLAGGSALRDYPDRSYHGLRQALAACHGLDPAAVLPGNGAAELFTWAARDAAACGLSLLPTPGFADYARALHCWGGRLRQLPLPLDWSEPGPLAWPPAGSDAGDAASVLWITNPHNPTGQLWSRASLEPLLARHALVIVDEAFLPLVPGGEHQSLVPLVPRHPQLVVIRSLTKLLAVAGLRLGYALGDPERLRRWAEWRDPWPINGLAACLGPELLRDRRWSARVQAWVADESRWLQPQLAELPGLVVMPSAANFRLLRSHPQRGPASLEPLRQALARRHRILLRDCRSFAGLDGRWLRLSLLDRRGHRRLLTALQHEWPRG